MARRKRRRVKRMTITQRYNRIAIGLKYFGIEVATKTRTTAKKLKELQKSYRKIRQELREQGNIDLPTIAQAYKYIKEQEAQPAPTPTREPLEYTDEILDETTFEFPIIEEFSQALEDFSQTIADAVEEVQDRYHGERLEENFIGGLTEITEKFNKALELTGTVYMAGWLAQSTEYEAFRMTNYASYEEVTESISSMIEVLDAIISQAESDFTEAQGETPFDV